MCNDNNMNNCPNVKADKKPVFPRDVDTVTYEIGKKTFIVTPVYRENTDKTVNDILLNLMIKDRESY